MQEVPFKTKGTRWHQHYLYKQLYKDFPLKKYDITMNDDFSYRCTMSISLKGTFDNAVNYYPPNNRTVAVKRNNTVFMGVHMLTGFNENDENDQMWNDLIDFVSTNENNIIICGYLPF